MKNLIQITAIVIGIAIPQLFFAQDVNPSEEVRKNDRKEIFEKHKAEIETIKNNTSLTEAQKEELITEKREALREKMGPRKRGGKKGKKSSDGEGKRGKKKGKKAKGELKQKLDAIDGNTSLSTEEKEAQKEALKAEFKRKDKGMHRGPRKGHKKMKEIENDSTLSYTEKATRKAEVKEKMEAKRAEGGRLNSGGKGPRGSRSAAERIEKKSSKRTLSAEEVTRAHKQLDKEEKRLQKLLKKEKIDTVQFNERIAAITKVRANLNNR